MATNQQRIDDMQNDIEEIKEMLESHTQSDTPRVTKSNIRDFANHAGQNMRQYFGEKREQMRDASERAEETIKSRPFTSTAVAFAAGALVTAMLNRK